MVQQAFPTRGSPNGVPKLGPHGGSYNRGPTLGLPEVPLHGSRMGPQEAPKVVTQWVSPKMGPAWGYRKGWPPNGGPRSRIPQGVSAKWGFTRCSQCGSRGVPKGFPSKEVSQMDPQRGFPNGVPTNDASREVSQRVVHQWGPESDSPKRVPQRAFPNVSHKGLLKRGPPRVV